MKTYIYNIQDKNEAIIDQVKVLSTDGSEPPHESVVTAVKKIKAFSETARSYMLVSISESVPIDGVKPTLINPKVLDNAHEIYPIYDKLSDNEKLAVMSKAFDLCQSYNGNSKASYICQAMGYTVRD